MIEPLSFVTALLMGLFGASHCLVMCGGIAATLGVRQSSVSSAIKSTLLFNAGRISSYVLAGVLVSALGLWLQEQHQFFMLLLRALAGVLLILMGLYIARWATWLTRLEQLGQYLWRFLQPHASKRMAQTSALSRWTLGMIWGFLPCGLIYSTLSWVAANADPTAGAIAMLAFGLGTLPAMMATSLMANQLLSIINRAAVRQVSGGLLILYGGWTLWAIQ